MKKESQQAPAEKLNVTLDGDLARRLQACARIERRTAEEVVAEALGECAFNRCSFVEC